MIWKTVILPLSLLFAIFFIYLASVSLAHEYNKPINNCAYEKTCYADEVSALTCSDNQVQFKSKGLPDKSNTMMTGITASNQQFLTVHDFTFHMTRHPELNARPTQTRPGAIGVAVNGVPLFDPSTQGPIDPETGKRPSAFQGGELDKYSGHAGRGDDYHYHIAPKCLIDDLGPDHVEAKRQPIGFAKDGFPILALGWFDASNDIEDKLDACRGITDPTGAYFYNVMHKPDWIILNCLAGPRTRGLPMITGPPARMLLATTLSAFLSRSQLTVLIVGPRAAMSAIS